MIARDDFQKAQKCCITSFVEKKNGHGVCAATPDPPLAGSAGTPASQPGPWIKPCPHFIFFTS